MDRGFRRGARIAVFGLGKPNYPPHLLYLYKSAYRVAREDERAERERVQAWADGFWDL